MLGNGGVKEVAELYGTRIRRGVTGMASVEKGGYRYKELVARNY